MRLVAIIFVFSLVMGSDSIAQTGPQDDYTLVWSDEFSGTGSPNSTLWFHQTQLPAGGNWFNGEQQHYTNRQSNSSVGNGVLKITARKEIFTDQGQTKQYTSARLNSKFAFTYGRVDVRAKLPTGAGTWPAIWMLGQNIKEPGGFFSSQFGTIDWPACGEIDIMEHWGNNPNVIHTSIHTPSSFGNTINTQTQRLSAVSSTFNVYSMIWDENKIDFLINDAIVYSYNPTIKNSATWPFSKPQYLLLNVAMGGVGGA
ncbi:MAG: family 16 glycosylhydrolase, partial [Flammeovirgaceae bacterium]